MAYWGVVSYSELSAQCRTTLSSSLIVKNNVGRLVELVQVAGEHGLAEPGPARVEGDGREHRLVVGLFRRDPAKQHTERARAGLDVSEGPRHAARGSS